MTEATGGAFAWLERFSPREWIRAADSELRRAEDAFRRRDRRAGVVGAKRAAGMALNGPLHADRSRPWGRTYVEHLDALSRDASAPERVREAALELLRADPPGGALIALGSKSADDALLEAARDVMAHALALVLRAEGAS